MAYACAHCGVAVDPLRNPATVIGNRVASLCRACAALTNGVVTTVNDVANSARTIIEGGADLAVRLVSCADCGEAVEPWRARPYVTGHTVKLRCVTCARARRGVSLADDASAPVDTLPPAIPLGGGTSVAASRARSARKALIVAAWGALGLGGVAVLTAIARPHVAAAMAVDVPVGDDLAPQALPPDPELAADGLSAVAGAITASVDTKHIVAHAHGGWIHPLPGSQLILPGVSDAYFGASRGEPGERPAECGAGHCGVDLVTDIGAPVVSIKDGVVAQIDNDADNPRGGRFVRVNHEGGVGSWYFHLDRIRSDLQVGDHVAAGELLGTVGRTGNFSTPTHLHFAITLDEEDGEHHVDPLPYLENATLIPQATYASR